eukprot:1117626-Pelagomonas_calceolata.AAC.1
MPQPFAYWVTGAPFWQLPTIVMVKWLSTQARTAASGPLGKITTSRVEAMSKHFTWSRKCLPAVSANMQVRAPMPSTRCTPGTGSS